jgi:hypothetical protein
MDMYTWLCVCVCVFMYVCMYLCMYCIYIYNVCMSYLIILIWFTINSGWNQWLIFWTYFVDFWAKSWEISVFLV